MLKELPRLTQGDSEVHSATQNDIAQLREIERAT